MASREVERYTITGEFTEAVDAHYIILPVLDHITKAVVAWDLLIRGIPEERFRKSAQAWAYMRQLIDN
ncbi:MAG: hypothetical protein ACRDFB_05255 [Rhabdochlamydiaceae bacterium]